MQLRSRCYGAAHVRDWVHKRTVETTMGKESAVGDELNKPKE